MIGKSGYLQSPNRCRQDAAVVVVLAQASAVRRHSRAFLFLICLLFCFLLCIQVSVSDLFVLLDNLRTAMFIPFIFWIYILDQSNKSIGSVWLFDQTEGRSVFYEK